MLPRSGGAQEKHLADAERPRQVACLPHATWCAVLVGYTATTISSCSPELG